MNITNLFENRFLTETDKNQWGILLQYSLKTSWCIKNSLKIYIFTLECHKLPYYDLKYWNFGLEIPKLILFQVMRHMLRYQNAAYDSNFWQLSKNQKLFSCAYQ
jgi:hypothetical protein